MANERRRVHVLGRLISAEKYRHVPANRLLRLIEQFSKLVHGQAGMSRNRDQGEHLRETDSALHATQRFKNRVKPRDLTVRELVPH